MSRKPYKMSPDRKDVAIMLELKKYPPGTYRQIGEAVHLSYVTIKRRIEWLERKGFVRQADNVPVGAPRGKILTENGFTYLENVSNF